jgi:S1-C subfamily serine protease
MNAIQGSASSAGSEQAPSASEQPGGGIPYGSYGGSSTYGSYGASGAGNFGSPPGSGGAGGAGGGGHWSGSNWSGGSNWGEGGQYPPKRRRFRRGMAFGAAGLAIAATAVGSYAAVQGGGSAAGHATTSSNTTLTTAQIAAKVDPGLVDVISTLGDQSATAEGTGIVLTSTGEVLTNNHVIDGATSVKVVDIGNGKTYTATVVGYDKTKDVAVLKLQNASGLQTAPLGNSSSVAVGQNVTALGNAEGKGGTPAVATGQVTALNQSITASDEGSSANSEQLTGMIQSNVPIQPGDSGGSLVSSSGQVIGMDTAASSASDSPSSQADTPGASNGGSGDSGTGSSGTTTATQAFSIPINTAVTIAQEIVAGDASSTIHIGATGFLGIEVAPAGSSSTGSSSTGGSGDGGFGSTGGSGFGSTGGSSDGGFGGFGGSSDGGFGSTGGSDGSGFGSTGGSSDGGFGSTGGSDGSGTTTSGATVEGTLSGSPAATAGLAAGDVITSVAGQTVTDPTQISSILSSDHPGDKVNVTWTDTSGASHTASITLAAGPAA